MNVESAWNMQVTNSGIIRGSEMHKAWEKIAEHYNPSFLEVEGMDGAIGDGVTVDER